MCIIRLMDEATIKVGTQRRAAGLSDRTKRGNDSFPNTQVCVTRYLYLKVNKRMKVNKACYTVLPGMVRGPFKLDSVSCQAAEGC